MKLIKTGIILILIGFAMVFIGTIVSSQKTNIGGLIMIGPIPIAFGTSPEITVIAMLIGVILMLLMFFLGRRNETPGKKSIQVLDTEPETKVKGGGVILIGPIPIVFGSDKRYAIIAILLTIALMLLALIFLYYTS
ncbi:MAG: DUF131 domain-containing protein [Candidatus Methanoperedens sp.]